MSLPLREDLKRSSFFVLRAPLLPFDEFVGWSRGLKASLVFDDLDRLSEALSEDRHRLRARLDDLIARPAVREALFVASPDLNASIDDWRHNPDSTRGKRVERALVRYFARMTGRATPFGLFAGYSVAPLGDETRLLIDDYDRWKRSTRLDMAYVMSLATSLETDQGLEQTLLYRPNSSIYPIAGRLHYLESKLVNRFRCYNLVAVDRSEYLVETLERAKEGISLPDLAEAVAGRVEIPLIEAKQYISELVDNQLLIPDLEPAVTGSEPVGGLVTRLKRIKHSTFADRLEEAQIELENLDAEGFGV